MHFEPLELPEVILIRGEPHRDERGAFLRTFCHREFAAAGIDPHVEQCSQSDNHRARTLRGLHFQRSPHEEGKLVRCVRGAIFDVVVDIRPSSSTAGRWVAVELDANEPQQLWVPPGFAHGFLTLEDDTRIVYQMNVPYHPEASAGYRWDDPTFAIAWPHEPSVISERDRQLPTFDRASRGASPSGPGS